MKTFFIVLVLIISSSLQATTYISQIIRIDPGKNNDPNLIYLSNGRIVKTFENEFILDLKAAVLDKSWLNISVDDSRIIKEIQKSENPVELTPPQFKLLNANEEYNPSILKSLDQARQFFYEAKINSKESQCYNRAHVWAYDWRVKHKVYSEKLWIYFTAKYIREFDFDWWFHVAPMVHVIADNKVKERVMDIKYSKGPLSINQWSDIFMRNLAKCPVVEKYTDQANNPESAYCYLMKSSMYYYQPVDLETLEHKSITKTRWLENEVRHAFEEAFEIKL